LKAKAQRLVAGGRARPYFFQPEFPSTLHLLQQSTVDMVRLYRFYSPASHGGFAGRLFFHDDPHAEDTSPQPHPKRTKNAVIESSRLTLEVCYIRDQVDNMGVGEEVYASLVKRIFSFR